MPEPAPVTKAVCPEKSYVGMAMPSQVVGEMVIVVPSARPASRPAPSGSSRPGRTSPTEQATARGEWARLFDGGASGFWATGGPSWIGGAELDRLAAVDDHRVPDGERGLVRAEPEHRRGDLLRAAEAADRFLGDDRRVALLGAADEAPDHLGVDDAGADGVDADALRRLLEGG